MSHPWTDERVELLTKRWNDGMSCSQIAAALGPGFTRNAVIGKVHRLGLSGRPTPARTANPRPRTPRQPTHPGRRCLMPTHGATALKPHAISLRALRPLPEPEPEPIRILDIPKGERVNLLMLNEKTCRWPIGDVGDPSFHFCGLEPASGRPYCEYHCRVGYERASSYRCGPFAPSENDVIREQWNGGENVPEIAQQLRRKPSTVWRQALVSLGLKTYSLEAAE